PCDTTPALSPGQPEPGNWGCRYVSALPDRKSRREQERPADHGVRPPCVNTAAPTRHRRRKDRHVHVRAGQRLRCDRAPRLVGSAAAARLAPSRPAPPPWTPELVERGKAARQPRRARVLVRRPRAWALWAGVPSREMPAREARPESPVRSAAHWP